MKALLIISIIFLSACTKASQTALPKRPPANEKLVNVVYPHTIEFYKEHGQAYLQKKEQCIGCHSAENVVGNPKASCTACHSQFPHPTGWVAKTQHAASYLNDPQSCSTCHGADGSGGTSSVSCLSCHDYPHPKKWAVPTSHGVTYAAGKPEYQASCFMCHNQGDPAAPELSTSPSCQNCHDAYPHDPDRKGVSKPKWRHPRFARTYEGKCTACHRNFTENMPKTGAEGGCKSCHENAELEIHWKDNEPPPPTPASTPERPADGSKSSSSVSEESVFKFDWVEILKKQNFEPKF